MDAGRIVNKEFNPDWVTHPGVDLLEIMCVDFVHNSGIDPLTLEKFIQGEQELTAELCELLCAKTGIAPQYWWNREKHFRDGLAAGKSWTR